MTGSQGESNVRTHDPSTPSWELGWSLSVRSLRALAPLTLSQDLVSYMLPVCLVGNHDSFLLAHRKFVCTSNLKP